MKGHIQDKGGEGKDCDGGAFKLFNHSRSTTEASLSREINELKGIIGELTIANETLKKFNLQGEVGRHD